MGVFLYRIFEMLTLHSTLREKKYYCLNYTLYVETSFFQAPAKQFFSIKLKKLTKPRKKPRPFRQRKLGLGGQIRLIKKPQTTMKNSKPKPQTEEFSF